MMFLKNKIICFRYYTPFLVQRYFTYGMLRDERLFVAELHNFQEDRLNQALADLALLGCERGHDLVSVFRKLLVQV